MRLRRRILGILSISHAHGATLGINEFLKESFVLENVSKGNCQN